jgi:hypothetical protein
MNMSYMLVGSQLRQKKAPNLLRSLGRERKRTAAAEWILAIAPPSAYIEPLRSWVARQDIFLGAVRSLWELSLS